MEIIIPHISTDLDALGAAVAAQVLYPQAVIVLPGSPNPLAADFISLHRNNLRLAHPREIDLEKVERAIVVDTADRARLGPLAQIVDRAEVHVYDHHPPDVDDVNASLEVRGLVGSTCTLFAELIEEAGAPLSPLQATAMLLGIYADTGSLSHMGTTDRDARAAAFLLASGATLRVVSRFIKGSLSPAQQSLLHQLQTRARWLAIRGARIRLLEAETSDYVGGLALVIHRLQEVLPAPALFGVVRMAERVYLIGRSEVPWVNVARILAEFGGGGHPTAASAVVKGASLEEVTARLKAVLDQLVDRPLMARDVMTTPVKTIPWTKPVREAERLMLRHGHSGMPVVGDGGSLAGIISLRDVEKARRHGLEHAPVKGIMIRHLVTVSPETPVDVVQDLMVERDIGRVPVVDGGNLLGIISRSDLLGLLYGGAPPRWHRTLYTGPAPGTPGGPDPAVEKVRQAVEAAPLAIRSLLRTIGAVAEERGVSAYAVGGFVRDLLLSRPNFDIDIAVEGDGISFARELAAVLAGRVKEVPRFGTAHVYLEQTGPGLPSRIDVATARREFYEHAAALPLVEHADLREDLYRRDFSINAMAVRLGSTGPGGLVDFFGGLQDLRTGHIRILHSLSFVEDPTRILRAVRFAHRFGFELEPETERCARSAIRDGYLGRVSIDRLRSELVLILQEPTASGALMQLQEMEGLGAVLPGVVLDQELCELLNRVDRIREDLPDLQREAEAWVTRLILLLHRLPVAEGIAVAQRLKLRKRHSQILGQALSGWRQVLERVTADGASPAAIVDALRDWSPEGLLALCLLGGGGPVIRFWREWRHVRLAIDGNDLIRAGAEQGPAIRRALERVLADRLNGAAPDRETQLSLALRYIREGA